MLSAAFHLSCIIAVADPQTGSAAVVPTHAAARATSSERSETRYHWGLEGAVGPASSVIPRNYNELWGMMGKVAVGARVYGRRLYLGGQAEGSFSTLPVQVSYRRAKQTFGSVGLVVSPGLRFGERHVGILALNAGWVYMRRTVNPTTKGMIFPDQQTFFGPTWGVRTRVEFRIHRMRRFKPSIGCEVRHLPLRVDGLIRHDFQASVLAGVAFNVR